MKIQDTDSNTLQENERPILYPKGTRVTSVTFKGAEGEIINYDYVVALAINEWCGSHDVDLDDIESYKETLEISMTYTRCQIIVEVSDRMRTWVK